MAALPFSPGDLENSGDALKEDLGDDALNDASDATCMQQVSRGLKASMFFFSIFQGSAW